MNYLILTCNTGGGHNSAAYAMQEYITSQGDNAVTLDFLKLKSERASRIIGGLYINMAKNTPRLFGFVYKLGAAISSPKRKSPVYFACKGMGKRLKAYLAEHPTDMIITTHLYPAETFAYMRKKGMLPQKTVAICTDYTCIPFWEETNCDYYILPHEDLREEYATHGVPKAKLISLGIPVKQDFTRHRDKAHIRKKLHLPVESPLFLVMSGSMGAGKLLVFAMHLAIKCKHGEHIVIICGTNDRIRKLLKKEFRWSRYVHLVGFTEHVSDYMDACDVLFTKPGGITSTEGLVKGIPMVHTAPIPGCETRNREFFVERGMSVAGDSIKEQVEKGFELLHSAEARKVMQKAQAANRHENSAEEIYAFTKSL